MVDLVACKTEVAFIVNSLAKAVVTEIFNAAEKVSLNKQNPETEKTASYCDTEEKSLNEKLGVLVDGLCVEAVKKILKVFEQQQETDGGLKHPSDDSEALICTQTAGENKSRSDVTLHGGRSSSSPADDHEYACHHCRLLVPPWQQSVESGAASQLEEEGWRCTGCRGSTAVLAVRHAVSRTPRGSPTITKKSHRCARYADRCSPAS
ncbi:uncharacterized protein LOC110970992 isoform X1 [Acanthochromis polyacanthus]|uniref:uncharacterized protein LOC110970992 isoform X1 n=1 Tax=Acanthochromis polyacanthus TaxID=80966 RepID=UPI002234117E|nr:uncharacterized protein LOC110970992 isoform X1 [Acanthochromis polyacanthus]